MLTQWQGRLHDFIWKQVRTIKHTFLHRAFLLCYPQGLQSLLGNDPRQRAVSCDSGPVAGDPRHLRYLKLIKMWTICYSLSFMQHEKKSHSKSCCLWQTCSIACVWFKNILHHFSSGIPHKSHCSASATRSGSTADSMDIPTCVRVVSTDGCWSVACVKGTFSCMCIGYFHNNYKSHKFWASALGSFQAKDDSGTYVLALRGISAFITVCTPGMSRPLAATSVQTWFKWIEGTA